MAKYCMKNFKIFGNDIPGLHHLGNLRVISAQQAVILALIGRANKFAFGVYSVFRFTLDLLSTNKLSTIQC